MPSPRISLSEETFLFFLPKFNEDSQPRMQESDSHSPGRWASLATLSTARVKWKQFPSVGPEQPWGDGPKEKARGSHTDAWSLDSIPVKQKPYSDDTLLL